MSVSLVQPMVALTLAQAAPPPTAEAPGGQGYWWVWLVIAFAVLLAMFIVGGTFGRRRGSRGMPSAPGAGI